MVLNQTSGNLYPIEQMCRDICYMTNNFCTVFAVFDMCKDVKEMYKELSLKEAKPVRKSIIGRGSGEETTCGVPFWHLDGAETHGIVDANSILALELLERL